MAKPLRILHLEDDQYDAELVHATLAAEGVDGEIVRVDTRAGFLAALTQGDFDLILSDYSMPAFDGIAALAIAREKCPEVPFLFVSGAIGEERAIETLKNGATDYVLKDRLQRLGPAVRRALQEARERAERQRAEEALQEEAEIAAALARVGRELIVSLDTPVMLERLCQLTAEVLRGNCSCTVLWQPQDEVYTPVANWGYAPEQTEALRVLHVPRTAAAQLMACLAAEELVEVSLPVSSAEVLPEALLLPFGLAKLLCLALWRGQDLIGLQACGYSQAEALPSRQLRIARGISQIASLALANAKLLEELEHANRLKDDFVSTMSHELRTPLNVIMGYTDLMLEGEFDSLTPEQFNVLRRVEKSARELLELIVTTLDLSRLERGRLPVELTEVDVPALIGEFQQETKGQYEKPGVTVSWQVAPELPRLHTDRMKLKVVLKNLLGNAVKFTEKGSVTVDISLRDGGVEISVADTGIGIPPKALPIIFEMFRQGDSSATRRYGGVGLGLYIVRRLLELVGGTVTVESEVGRGSTFRVWIPNSGSTTLC